MRGIGVHQPPSRLIVSLNLCGGHASDGQRNRVSHGDPGQRPVGVGAALQLYIVSLCQGASRGLDLFARGARGRTGHRRGQGPRAVRKDDASLYCVPLSEGGREGPRPDAVRPVVVGGHDGGGWETGPWLAHLVRRVPRSSEERLVHRRADERGALEEGQDETRGLMGDAGGVEGGAIGHESLTQRLYRPLVQYRQYAIVANITRTDECSRHVLDHSHVLGEVS